jgi:hypothetical protein
MTIKVGDEVQVYYGSENGWSDTLYTVLAIQDHDYGFVSNERKWAVVAFKSDIPTVHKLCNVRKKQAIVEVTVDGVVGKDGNVFLRGDLWGSGIPVQVTFTKVDGVISLDYPYTVRK